MKKAAIGTNQLQILKNFKTYIAVDCEFEFWLLFSKVSALSSELIDSMVKRRDSLKDNIVMLSAVYLDRRFTYELSNEQKAKAVEPLIPILPRFANRLLIIKLPEGEPPVGKCDKREKKGATWS